MSNATPGSLRTLLRQARAVVEVSRARSHVTRAWDLLQERDPDGNPTGPVPYTEDAIEALEAARDADPDDVEIVHHLAIARHARAWDRELAGDPGARDDWEAALGLWRTIAAAGSFWAALERKLVDIQKDADPLVVRQLRRRLLEDLLDVHVDFVRHYTESGNPQRARAHVAIVERASLPPALRRRLVDKVYRAMTGEVPASVAAAEYDSALALLERFLGIFPNHLPAIRSHVEVAHKWLETLPYDDKWAEIIQLLVRAEPWTIQLRDHPDLGSDVFAAGALEELCLVVSRRARDRAFQLQGDRDEASLSALTRDAAKGAFQVGLEWARRASDRSASGSSLPILHGNCANALALLICQEVSEVSDSSASDERLKLATMLRLQDQAVALIEEAASLVPDDDVLRRNLEIVRRERQSFEMQYRLAELR